jgi:hypothetical protein
MYPYICPEHISSLKLTRLFPGGIITLKVKDFNTRKRAKKEKYTAPR